MLATAKTQSPARVKGATVHRIETARAAKRSRIRRRLRSRATLIKHLAAVATDFIEGADPGDAVYFLRLLRDRCDEAIRAAD